MFGDSQPETLTAFFKVGFLHLGQILMRAILLIINIIVIGNE
jgi:hypothetical protein